MEIEELCNINISPLVTIPFATQWSPDNQISIITERGVHILELIPSPMSSNPTIKCARSFIHPSDVSPADTFVNEIDLLIWNLKREEIYSLFMEEALTPQIDGIKNAIVRIAQIAWSPRNLISPSQCVLAILTTLGGVELLHKVSNEWYSICDISSHRLKVVQNGITASFNEKSCNRYADIIKNMRQLQACSMTWSELFKVEKISFAYFSVAYRSGDILIWKIPRIFNFMESLQPVLVATIGLNIIVKINVLCWVTINANEHLLVIGYFDGRIYGVKLIYNNNNLQIASIEKYIDPDRIAINYLCLISQNTSNIKILAAKGYFLLLLCINSKGILKEMRFLQIDGCNITGITSIAEQQFLITTQDSHTLVVDTQSNDLINIVIKNNLPQTRVQYLGLAHSQNKIMFINVTSPSTVHDHLVIREPSIMHIFTIKGATCDPLSVIDTSTDLMNIWDCMEALRLKAAKTGDNLLSLIPKKFESSSLYNLQISMWMTVILQVCTTKKPMSNIDHIKECKITQELPLIFLYSTCAYLENLTKKKVHSNDQVLAMNLLKKYVKIHFVDVKYESNEDIIHRCVQEILNATAFCPNQVEKCNLCNTVIEISHAKSCPLGHKLPRCTTTLLQITSLEYLVCPMCEQIFHPCLNEVFEEPRCQICDVPILRNPYVFDIDESKLYGRNLSCLQIEDSSKDLNVEESSDRQQTATWHTLHMDPEITNDNDDEFDQIIEKWEEF